MKSMRNLFLVTSLLASVVAGCGANPSGETGSGSTVKDNGALFCGKDSICVFNGQTVLTLPNNFNRGILLVVNGRSTGRGQLTPDTISAYQSMLFIRDYFRNTYGRDSYDGRGSPIMAVVEFRKNGLLDPLGMRQNAAWTEIFSEFIFGGGGAQLGSFTGAIDVVGHEFTHAIVSTTSKLANSGQSGALNEHLADVFGEILQHAQNPSSKPFMIGDTVTMGANAGRPLRDMLDPHNSLTPQPAHMNEIDAQYGNNCQASANNDNCGVHLLNGVPNKAAALIIQRLGWDVAAPMFYKVMTERLTAQSKFADYRNALVRVCMEKLGSEGCSAVEESFQTVGL